MVPERLLLSVLGLILFAVAVLVALRLVAPRHSGTADDPLDLVLSVTGWTLIAIALLVTGLVLFGPLSLPLGIAALIILAEAGFQHRAAQRYALLWVLTVAAERFIPLVPAIRAFARERGGLFARRASRLADMLEAGIPLPEALRRSRGLIPREAIPLIAVGYQCGAVAPALRQAASSPTFHIPVWHSLASKVFYLCLLIWVALCVAAFITFKIVPAFQKIFADFGGNLPPMTEKVLVAADWAGVYVMPVALPLLLLVGVYTLLHYVGWLSWGFPGLNRIMRRLDTAVILDALWLVARQERPLPEGIAVLAESYPKASVRRRLRAAARDVLSGADWCESLFRRGLIQRADRAVLQAAQRTGNLPWALRDMADSNRRRLAYRLYVLVQMLFPPVILALGLLVMLFIVGLFLPLVTLIQKLA